MIDSLSQREKKLIYILVCFLIVVVGWFLLIKPTLDKNAVLKEEYSMAQLTLTERVQELLKYQAAPKALAEVTASYQEIVNQYIEPITNESVDTMFTTAILYSNLEPTALNINNITVASQTEGEESVDSKFYTISISANVKGSLVQTKNFIDYIDQLEGVELKTLSIDLNDMNNEVAFSCDLYMIRK